MMRKKIINRGLFLILFALIICGRVYGLEFTADKVNYNIDSKKSNLKDNVVIKHEGRILVADEVKIDTQNNEAQAYGDVVIVSDDELIYLERVNFNFSKNEGSGENGITFEYPWIIEGKRIEKKGNDIYVYDAKFYPSSSIDSLISFKAKKVIVKNRKYLIMKNITQYMGNVPVFWVPYLKKNISDERNNLNISPGKNSNYGAYVKSSYRYWFRPEIYGRVHLDIMEKRGVGVGLDTGIEYEDSQTYIQSYYINDKDFKPIRSDKDPEGKEDRYCINLKSYTSLQDMWVLTIEGNKQSDIDFYDDFFYDENFRDEVQKRNFVLLSKNYRDLSLSLLVEKRLNDFFNVLEKEPEVSVDYNNYYFEDYNIYHKFSFKASRLNMLYANDSREKIDLSRFYMENNFSYPMKFYGWLNIKPELSIENTYYSEDIGGDSVIRNIFTGETDLFVKFYKTFYPQKIFIGYDRFRHVFEPHITYYYRPEPNYENKEIHQLDYIDNKPELNKVKLDLRNLIQGKYGEEGSVKTLLSGSFYIFYDFLEDKFSNIGYKWDLRPVDWFSADLEGTIDKDNGNLLNAIVDVAFYYNDDFGATLGWVYRKDNDSLLTPEVFLNIAGDWFLRGGIRYNDETNENEYSEFSIVKEFKGINMAFQYRKRHLRNEETFMVVFSLTDYPKTNVSLR